MQGTYLTNLGSMIVPVTVCTILAILILTIFFGLFRHSDNTIALVILIVGYICAGAIIYLVGNYMFHRSLAPAAVVGGQVIEQTYDASEMERWTVL